MERRAPMLAGFERRGFGLCIFNNQMIMVAGGYSDTEVTAGCELYDVVSDLWARTGDLNVACCDPCLCVFGDKAVFKFGGMLGSQNLCQTIERYDKQMAEWTTVKYTLPEGIHNGFSLLRNSVAMAIDDKTILVCGGINIYYEGSNQTFFFRIDPKKDEEEGEKKRKVLRFRTGPNETYRISDVNSYCLPNKDPLEQCTPLMLGNEIYILSIKKTAQRRLINFAKNSWREIKDIKW